MARKRARKKRLKRRDELDDRLRELARRGADEEFLKLAGAELPDPAAPPLGSLWAEVADRALLGALAAGDLDRLARLLPSLGPAGRRRPPAALAAAVVDLAAGRLDAGRAKLEALEAAGGLEPAQGRALVPRLLALAGGGGRPSSAAAGELREISRLLKLAEETAGTAAAELPPPGRIRLRDPLLRGARDLLLALRRLEAAGDRPEAGERRALNRAVRRLREAPGAEDAALGRLLDAAQRLLSLLGALERIERRLFPAHLEESASGIVLDELHRPGGALARALAETSPPLLAPLAHAVRLAWRGLLETVAAREATEGLATLAAARPELLQAEAELPSGAGGQALREARRTRSLLAAGRFGELVALLRARARTEPRASALAALWSLELWARGQAAPSEDDFDAPFGEAPFEAPPHAAAVRIEEMAGQIGRRFPAEQRSEVARVLRDELFDLAELVALCEHFAGAAAALLDHLPGDAGLLIVGLTGAIAGEDRRCRQAIERHLERRATTIQPSEREAALRMMAQVALEDPPVLAPALEALRPLFAEADWTDVSERVARRAAPGFGSLLVEASVFPWPDQKRSSVGCELVRQELEPLRAVLGATPGFAAVELALDCWEAKRSDSRKRVRTLLDAEVGYETALLAVEVLEPAFDSPARVPAGALAALADLSEAVIDRLDDRWQRWWDSVPILALGASRARLRKLAQRIERLLATELDTPASRALEGALEAVRTVENAQRALGRRGPAPRRKGRPRGRRPAGKREPSAAPGDGRRKRRRDDPDTRQLDLDLG